MSLSIIISVRMIWKWPARNRSNIFGAEWGHLVKVSKIPFHIITVEYLKMTARSMSNSSGAELGHLVKVSKIPFQYIITVFLNTGLVKMTCFLAGATSSGVEHNGPLWWKSSHKIPFWIGLCHCLAILGSTWPLNIVNCEKTFKFYI